MLYGRLGYEFVDEQLLDIALTHRSVGSRNNERLEFLGDAILNFTVAEALFERFPSASEGDLSRLRALLVKGETLSEVALELDLGQHLNLGEGELKSGGFRRASILADAIEAIIGAIHLDSGMAQAKKFVLSVLQNRLDGISLQTYDKDPKTQLQEWLQARKKPLPVYEVIEVSGASHCQMFTVSCTSSYIGDASVATAGSRRAAEKEAANLMLVKLEKMRG